MWITWFRSHAPVSVRSASVPIRGVSVVRSYCVRSVAGWRSAGAGLSLQELFAHCDCDGLGAVCRAELGIDFVQMLLDARL